MKRLISLCLLLVFHYLLLVQNSVSSFLIMPKTTAATAATTTTTTRARTKSMAKTKTETKLALHNSEKTPNDAPPPTPTSNQRIELFFTSLDQLKERIHFFQERGYRAFNLVNKNAQDDLWEWIRVIRQEFSQADICAHYSLKYNKVARKGNEAHLELLQSFLQECNNSSSSNNSSSRPDEILLVSGGYSPQKPRPNWNTVKALDFLLVNAQTNTRSPTFSSEEDNHHLQDRPCIAVAYNPYIPDATRQAEENTRLEQKLASGMVSKVYLQFGTDLQRLKTALETLTNSSNSNSNSSTSNSNTFLQVRPTKIAGSLFLPTKQLIAQQKFRPWNGVHLSSDFLSGPEAATSIVVEIMKLYQEYNVEILWEAPGIRADKDLQFVQELVALRDADAASCSMVQQQPTKNNDHKSPERKRIKTTNDQDNTLAPCLLLFGSHDVRLYDNLAVQHACQNHKVVIPVFLWHSSMIESGGIRAEALEVLLKQAVDNLQQSLKSFGLELICRNCRTLEDAQKELTDLLQETRASAVYYNKDFTPNGHKLEEIRTCMIKENFSHVQTESFQSVLLYDIDEVSLTKGFHGGHWGTLMPFYKNCQKQFGPPRRPIPKHETFAQLQRLEKPSQWPRSDKLTFMAILPQKHRPWHQPILDRYPELCYEGAEKELEAFFQSTNSGFARYESERSRADKELATSRLSVHFRLGTLSPNILYWKTQDNTMDDMDKKTFTRRLIWRDLAYYQLKCFPKMSTQAIRIHYQNSEWVTGEEESRRLEAWKWGKTGYPIVDAGMRELYKTGWMTQSIRMVVASFLVEYLRVNWVKGCEFFHYTLADADTAINAMMWQNAGKCGIDQWNFVLSPETASQDPSGKYTRTWVPELADLPTTALMHRPWQAPPDVLKQAGVVLGQTYPHRIVTDLKDERAKGIESTLKLRRQSQHFNDDRGYDTVELPNGDRTVVFTKKEYRINRSGQVMQQKSSHAAQKSRGRGKARNQKKNEQRHKKTSQSVK